MEQIPFIDLKAQYAAYKQEIDSAIARVLESAAFVQGPEVSALERELGEYAGVEHCVSCASGTAALYIALRALGVGRGDEVITTGFSFFATAGAISLTGATPVFIDIEPTYYSMDASRIEPAITPRTKAIVVVGLYGQTADMDAVDAIASQRGIPVVEDAAQSFGATWRGKRSCGLSAIGCTSFYPAKPLGAYGEGGAVFTQDEGTAVRMRQIMNQGQRAGYDHVTVGINGRMHSLQAAVLRVKLAHFEEELAMRSRVARRYDEAIAELHWTGPPRVREHATSVFAQYTLRVDYRASLREYLASLGVPTAVHYPKPIYRQDAYASFGAAWVQTTALSCLHSEQAAEEVLSLPFGPFLSQRDQERVIAALHGYKGG